MSDPLYEAKEEIEMNTVNEVNVSTESTRDNAGQSGNNKFGFNFSDAAKCDEVLQLNPNTYSAGILLMYKSSTDAPCAQKCLRCQVVAMWICVAFIQFVLIFFSRLMTDEAEKDLELDYEDWKNRLATFSQSLTNASANTALKDWPVPAIDPIGKCGSFQTNFVVRVLCVGIFTACCISDFTETWNIFNYLRYVMGFGCCTAGLEEVKDNDGVRKSVQENQVLGDGVRLCGEDGEESDDLELYNFVRAMRQASCCHKVSIFVFILLTRFAITVLVLLYGTGFIVATTANADVILNSMALVFILECDELFYEFFLDKELKNIVDNQPRIKVINKTSCYRVIMRRYGVLIRFFFLGLFGWISLEVYCKRPDKGWSYLDIFKFGKQYLKEAKDT